MRGKQKELKTILYNQTLNQYKDNRSYLQKVKDFVLRHQKYANFLLEHFQPDVIDREDIGDPKSKIGELTVEEHHFAGSIIDLISSGDLIIGDDSLIDGRSQRTTRL